MKIATLAGAVALAAGASVAHAGSNVYTDEASFLGQVQGGYYFENFSSVAQGANPALSFGPVNGYAYTIDSTTPDGLFNGPGFISTNTALEALTITFTGADVTAVGGNFWGTDINFFAIPADISITLSDGTMHAYSTSAATGFAGFISDTAISSISISASDALGGNVWTTLDNLYVGSAVPTPGALALFGVAGLAASRRRR